VRGRAAADGRARATRARLDFGKRRRTLFQHYPAPANRNQIFAFNYFNDRRRRPRRARRNFQIKWVNDILVGGKKICGILAETVETNKGQAVIVGIGINLKSTNFPPEIADSATSLAAETGQNVNSEELLEALTRFFGDHYEILRGGKGAEKIRQEWTRRSSYAFGKSVRVALENETIQGTTRGLEENGALRVETDAGAVRIIQAGDVEMLRKI
jgi:BirA family transcriptional regulator, biotin operon repressor / biotin---[acetyl-CoA-carboxylase] ligase